MSNEIIAALAGAVVGAVIAGILSFLQSLWSAKMSRDAERDRQRLALVREVMRYRLDQKRLTFALNEVPLLFGDNVKVLQLYREVLDAKGAGYRTHLFTDLINCLASVVKIPPNVQIEDVRRGFAYVASGADDDFVGL